MNAIESADRQILTADEVRELSSSTVCVTGAAGFIGSHVCNALTARGASVVAIDNLTYGVWRNAEPRVRDSMRCISRDLCAMDVPTMARALAGCSTLFHLAAEKHTNSSGPQRVLETNIAATQRLFEAAGRAGVKRIVFTSSVYAYGRLSGRAMREGDAPAPCTVYGASKLAGEGLLREAAKRWGLVGRSLRLFFTYGPRQYCGSGYPSVIVRNFARILDGERPVVNGTGQQILDYVYVDDVVRAIAAAAITRADVDVINVGSGHGVSINYLTKIMLSTAGSQLRPRQAAADWTEESRRVGDIRLAASALKWKPRVSLKDGLAGVWSWMQHERR